MSAVCRDDENARSVPGLQSTVIDHNTNTQPDPTVDRPASHLTSHSSGAESRFRYRCRYYCRCRCRLGGACPALQQRSFWALGACETGDLSSWNPEDDLDSKKQKTKKEKKGLLFCSISMYPCDTSPQTGFLVLSGSARFLFLRGLTFTTLAIGQSGSNTHFPESV